MTPPATQAPTIKPGDWNQWGGSSARNNTPEAKNLPDSWEMPKFKDDGNWEPGTGKHIKWAARLGSQSYGNPVVANAAPCLTHEAWNKFAHRSVT